MDKGKVVYYVNGVASNMFTRLVGSKTFWVVLATVAGLYTQYLQNAITWGQFLIAVQVGIIGIFLRGGTKKSELASNALDSNVTHIQANSENK